MQKRQLVLTVDLGTSGPKVCVFDEKANLIDSAFAPVELVLLEKNGVEQRPQDWINAILQSYNIIRQRGLFTPAEVVAVNITTQWSGTVPIDKNGKPLMNCLIWMDARGAKHADKITRGPITIDGYDIFKVLKWIKITGGAPTKSGKDSIAHILYLKHEQPELYKATYKFLEPKDYLNFYFTGKVAATYDSITLHWVTDNRNINNITYSDTLLKASGLEREKLPDLLPANSILGKITPEIATLFGLNENVQVVSGTPDTHSASIGSGAVKDHEAHLYIGTSSWLITHLQVKKTDLLHNIATIPSSVPGRYMVINEQETTGACLNFVKNNILYSKDAISVDDAPQDFYRRADELVESTPAGSNGVLFTPWLNGERSPVDDHYTRASFINLSMGTTRGDMMRSVYEGIALNNRWLLQYVEQFCGKPFEAVNFIGGGALSDIWCQILADVFNRPIKQIADPVSANSRGTALLALVALGLMKTEDIAATVAIKKTYHPQPQNRAIYDEKFAVFVDMYKRNKSLFKRLNG